MASCRRGWASARQGGNSCQRLAVPDEEDEGEADLLARIKSSPGNVSLDSALEMLDAPNAYR
jgi:hypothetical protein